MDLKSPGAVLLISCYELGHQPLGVASPLGYLSRAGYTPAAMDIAVEDFDESKILAASFIAICVPMHTAMRLGVRVVKRIQELNPSCKICCYGMYASLNSDYLLDCGADFCIGGEFEAPLLAVIDACNSATTIELPGVTSRGHKAAPNLERIPFAVPDRSQLPILSEYAELEHNGKNHTTGYAETSRGCLHLCTHCPIPPVYEGRFFILPKDVVLEDIRRQVAAGATHITFGDPDFLNGPKHSLGIVQAMHEEFPDLTFDFTAKVEHLLNRADHLDQLAAAGCLFIITAVESLSDRVLTILDKRHTHADVVESVRRVRAVGIEPRPTWVTFTPWTTLEDFVEVLDFIEDNGLIENIDPVQYSIRLLVPPGSWLADHEETIPYRGELDQAALTYRWTHPDPRMDQLQKDISALVESDATNEVDAGETFFRIRELTRGGEPSTAICSLPPDRQKAPRLTEPWFC